MPVRVAAIDFLNPAPLMWDFYHAPRAAQLRTRYQLHQTTPTECARDLLAGRADLGLIPIAALTDDLVIVPGCTISSLRQVRSIQLIVKAPLGLGDVRSVATDAASRSSAAYTEVIFRHFIKVEPRFSILPADPISMLREHDSCLLIGDPALLALERRAEIEAETGACTWHDVASLWHERTGLPWVAAVWAAQPAAFTRPGHWAELVADLAHSRDAGLAHRAELVTEWTPRIAIPPDTIATYLNDNIHYQLDPACITAIHRFRELAAATGTLPTLSAAPFRAIDGLSL